MSNVIRLAHSRKSLHQRAAFRRLRQPLDERIALADFAAKRLAFYADPCDETERTMLEARDGWSEAFQVAQGRSR